MRFPTAGGGGEEWRGGQVTAFSVDPTVEYFIAYADAPGEWVTVPSDNIRWLSESRSLQEALTGPPAAGSGMIPISGEPGEGGDVVMDG